MFKNIIAVLTIVLLANVHLYSMDDNQPEALRLLKYPKEYFCCGKNTDDEILPLSDDLMLRLDCIQESDRAIIFNDVSLLDSVIPHPDLPWFAWRNMTANTDDLNQEEIERALNIFYDNSSTLRNVLKPYTQRILSHYDVYTVRGAVLEEYKQRVRSYRVESILHPACLPCTGLGTSGLGITTAGCSASHPATLVGLGITLLALGSMGASYSCAVRNCAEEDLFLQCKYCDYCNKSDDEQHDSKKIKEIIKKFGECQTKISSLLHQNSDGDYHYRENGDNDLRE